MNPIRKILKTLAIIIIILVVAFAGMIAYAVISDYKPEEKIVQFTSGQPTAIPDSSVISLMIWNIGYAGLDSEMDFFYDGGTKVRTPEDKCYQNLRRIGDFFRSNDSIDIFLVQEIDKDSKRSYHINQFDTLRNIIGGSASFGKNYDVFFVPVPPASPMGKVHSGIATFSRFVPAESVRYSFPGQYGFPKQLFMLDRCFLVNRYPLKDGKELLVINTHNEAFDPGEIRRTQMTYLRDFLLSEYEKGNFIIAGGDWNQAPPDFKPGFTGNPVRTEQMKLSSDYLPPEWKWVYDNNDPTNRSVTGPYQPAVTTTTVIDMFLVSPNVSDLSVDCINLGFENSDHNPVRIVVRLGKE